MKYIRNLLYAMCFRIKKDGFRRMARKSRGPISTSKGLGKFMFGTQASPVPEILQKVDTVLKKNEKLKTVEQINVMLNQFANIVKNNNAIQNNAKFTNTA